VKRVDNEHAVGLTCSFLAEATEDQYIDFTQVLTALNGYTGTFRATNNNFSTLYVRLFTARRNARIASAVLAIAIPSVYLSVSPSVRPSVRHTPVLCQNDGT